MRASAQSHRVFAGFCALSLCGFAACSPRDKKLAERADSGAGGEAGEVAGAPNGVAMGGTVSDAGAGGETDAAVGSSLGGEPSAGGMTAVAGTSNTGGTMPGTAGAPGAQPTRITNAPQTPTNLQVLAGYLYFSDAAGRVRRVDGGGKIAEVGAAQNVKTPPAFALHGSSAYVATSPTASSFAIAEFAVDGGAEAPFTTTPALATAILVDDDYLYYAAETAIMRVGLTDKQQTPLAANVPPSPALALDQSNLYFALASGSVNVVPIVGGAPTPLATQQAMPHGLLVDATNAYWLNETSATTGTVMVAPVMGASGARPLFATSGNPVALAIDEIDAYVASGDGTIQKAKLDGSSAPQTIATGQGQVVSLGLDDEKIYWISGTGDLFSLAL